ncbi:MAG: endonuclease/exonuclease/phosphatase family protein [Tabrizicola sp.]|nr:endonuclease/exonuclease/phosphatase family protein [Tabrizicola sp.]
MDGNNETWPKLIGAALVLAILALIGGYLGWLHPIGDSLAVGRGMAALAVLFLAVMASFAGLRMAAFGSLLLAMVTGGQVLLAYNWPGPPGSYLVYQKNMLYRNGDLASLAADIRATSPEIVTLQEVSEPNLALLAELEKDFPNQHVCKGGRVGGTAVLTRLATVADTGFCAPGMAAIQVAGGGNRFWVVSVHLQWPWPYRQAGHVELILPVLDKLQGPAILAGDFNMVRWANSVKRLADILGVRPAGPTVGTFFGFSQWFRLPIDHVFASGSGRVAPRGAQGSDHLGLLAEVEL